MEVIRELPIYAVVAFVSWLVGMQFPLPLQMEAFFQWFLAPLAGLFGYAVGKMVWQERPDYSTGTLIIFAVLCVAIGICTALAYLYMYYNIAAPSVLLILVEMLVFAISFASFFCAAAAGRIALLK